MDAKKQKKDYIGSDGGIYGSDKESEGEGGGKSVEGSRDNWDKDSEDGSDKESKGEGTSKPAENGRGDQNKDSEDDMSGCKNNCRDLQHNEGSSKDDQLAPKNKKQKYHGVQEGERKSSRKRKNC